MIRKKDLEFIAGRMGRSMKGCGGMESNMDLESWLVRWVRKKAGCGIQVSW